MDLSTEAVLERQTLQATDPQSGNQYHLLYNPPMTEDIKARLKVNPKNDDTAIRARLAEYYAHRDELVDYYNGQGAHRVIADQDTHTVFETLEGHIVNPPPTSGSDLVYSNTSVFGTM